MAVAESAPQANRRSVCIICIVQQYNSISTDTERFADLSVIAELLVKDFGFQSHLWNQ